MDKPQWKLIGRGFNGWHAIAGGKFDTRSSGGQLEPYTYWTGEKCTGYAGEAENGAPVYDASACENTLDARNQFIRLTISGPMVKADLPDEGPAAYVNAGPLDYVSIAEYMRRVQQIPGVRIGTIQNGQVVWNS